MYEAAAGLAGILYQYFWFLMSCFHSNWRIKYFFPFYIWLTIINDSVLVENKLIVEQLLKKKKHLNLVITEQSIGQINNYALSNSSDLLLVPLGLQTTINLRWTPDITFFLSLRLPEAHHLTSIADRDLIFAKLLCCDKNFSKAIHLKNISSFHAHYVTGISLFLVVWRYIRGTIQEIGIFHTANAMQCDKNFSLSSQKKYQRII